MTQFTNTNDHAATLLQFKKLVRERKLKTCFVSNSTPNFIIVVPGELQKPYTAPHYLFFFFFFQNLAWKSVLMLASHLSKTENKIFTWYFGYCTHERFTYFNIGFATVKLILSSSSVFPSYVSKLVCTLIIISFLEYMFIMYVYNINY